MYEIIMVHSCPYAVSFELVLYDTILCERVWEKGPYGTTIEIEIWAPEVSNRKNSFFLQFLFFAELVLVTLTLRLCQI